MTVTADQITLVNHYLPTAAKELEANGGYGWTDDYIETLMETMAFSPAQAVRYFWYQRVQETAEYLDVGKPLTQIHRQAKEMLDYWDLILKTNPEGMVPINARAPISFGEIEGVNDEANYC
jgi:hypothetical protein